jgi:hypothetical protein
MLSSQSKTCHNNLHDQRKMQHSRTAQLTLMHSCRRWASHGNWPKTYHSAQHPHSQVSSGTWTKGQWTSQLKRGSNTSMLSQNGSQNTRTHYVRSKRSMGSFYTRPTLSLWAELTSLTSRLCWPCSTTGLFSHRLPHETHQMTSTGGRTPSTMHTYPNQYLDHALSSTSTPIRMLALAMESASSSTASGEHGNSSLGGRGTVETLDGLRVSASSFSSAQSSVLRPPKFISRSMEITESLLRVGGQAKVGIGHQTKSSNVFIESSLAPSAQFLLATSQAGTTQLMVLPVGCTPPPSSSCPQLISQLNYSLSLGTYPKRPSTPDLTSSQ